MWRQSMPSGATSWAHEGTLQRVRNAAVLPDGRADALLRVRDDEVTRRAGAGLTQQPYPPLLDALLALPNGVEVPWACLGDRVRRLLTSAPPGVVALGDAGVRRLLTPAVVVSSVTVPGSGGRWSPALRRAASFARVAPSTVIVRREPTPEQLLEADFAGVGVEVADGPDRPPRQVLAPADVRPRFNASLWAFYERAYGVWLTADGGSARPEAARPDARTP